MKYVFYTTFWVYFILGYTQLVEYWSDVNMQFNDTADTFEDTVFFGLVSTLVGCDYAIHCIFTQSGIQTC